LSFSNNNNNKKENKMNIKKIARVAAAGVGSYCLGTLTGGYTGRMLGLAVFGLAYAFLPDEDRQQMNCQRPSSLSSES
jgi:hypothetical protein